MIDCLARGLLEFFDAIAQALGQLRQLLGPKQDKHQRQNQNNLAAAKVKQSKHRRHIGNLSLNSSLDEPRNRVKRQSDGFGTAATSGNYRKERAPLLLSRTKGRASFFG